MSAETHKKSEKRVPGTVYIDIIPLLQPIGIILGLITLYISLAKQVDIYTSVFRSALVFGGFVFLGVVFHYVYVLMLKRVKELEARRIAEEIREAEEKVNKEIEEQIRAAQQQPQQR